MTQYYVESIDELEHYGVKGMKWGVIRNRIHDYANNPRYVQNGLRNRASSVAGRARNLAMRTAMRSRYASDSAKYIQNGLRNRASSATSKARNLALQGAIRVRNRSQMLRNSATSGALKDRIRDASPLGALQRASNMVNYNEKMKTVDSVAKAAHTLAYQSKLRAEQARRHSTTAANDLANSVAIKSSDRAIRNVMSSGTKAIHSAENRLRSLSDNASDNALQRAGQAVSNANRSLNNMRTNAMRSTARAMRKHGYKFSPTTYASWMRGGSV